MVRIALHPNQQNHTCVHLKSASDFRIDAHLNGIVLTVMEQGREVAVFAPGTWAYATIENDGKQDVF